MPKVEKLTCRITACRIGVRVTTTLKIQQHSTNFAGVLTLPIYIKFRLLCSIGLYVFYSIVRSILCMDLFIYEILDRAYKTIIPLLSFPVNKMPFDSDKILNSNAFNLMYYYSWTCVQILFLLIIRQPYITFIGHFCNFML
jgi:hypothetical protein